ncbi:MAG: formylglycine-generating enzyme family protein [Magnetococcales bacterium]|nr:formylglycine-generating enzyme family protein [Magnetococcales bacterium]NGZ06059.1 formylglycine-generating enzyme family protein [Magnetococcales bacterium]
MKKNRLLKTRFCVLGLALLSLTTSPLYADPQTTIRSLTRSAEQDLHGRRFTQPKGMNALEKYQQILALDPDSPHGLEGLRKIIASFQRLAREAEQHGHTNLARQRLHKAQRVQTLLDRHKTTRPPTTNQPEPAMPRPIPPQPAPPPQADPTAAAPASDPAEPTPVTTEPSPAVEPAPRPTPDPKRLPARSKEESPPPPSAPEAKRPDSVPKVQTKGENGAGLRTRAEPVTGIEFIELPGGCFQMGSEQHDPDEVPVHEVCVPRFWMSRTEVTNGQYRRFDPKHDSTSYDGRNLNGDLQPVVHVTWDEANQFARWMSGRGGVQFRLPTEAEWEYAARGGTTSAFIWGDDPAEGCRHANVGDATAKQVWPKWNVFPCSDGYAETAPVGMFLPNRFGLYDMIGNVWEWVADWYTPRYYASSPKENPPGPAQGFFRAARGGSWAVWPDYARTANRTGIDPAHPDLHVGFRLVMIP